MKKMLVLSLFFIHAVVLYAQKDTNYIVQFERPYNVQFNTWLNKYDFFINPPRFSNSSSLIKLSPNGSWQAGLSLGLKHVTIAFGVQIPNTQNNEKTFGRTNYYDFSFSYYQSWGGGEVYSRSFNGVYRSDELDSITEIRPDAKIEAHGINFFYNFNYKKFSYRSALSMAEFQKKSSGSMLLMFNAGFKSIKADSSLIPKNIDNVENYSELSKMRYLSLYNLSVRPGYAYNFCIKGGNWFISPSAFLGLGIAKYVIKNSSENNSGFSFETDTHYKLSIGRNGTKHFWNIYATYDASLNAFSFPNFVANQSTSIGFNFGYRFYKLIPKIKWL